MNRQVEALILPTVPRPRSPSGPVYYGGSARALTSGSTGSNESQPHPATIAYLDGQEIKLQSWASSVIDQINLQGQVGPVLASGPSISLAKAIHHVSGTAAIKNIILPAGVTGVFYLIADGNWSTLSTGNISAAVSATAGRCYAFVYDGKKCYPLTVA